LVDNLYYELEKGKTLVVKHIEFIGDLNGWYPINEEEGLFATYLDSYLGACKEAE